MQKENLAEDDALDETEKVEAAESDAETEPIDTALNEDGEDSGESLEESGTGETDREEDGELDGLAVAEEELQVSQDRLMRLAAEFDNYKKRTSREIGLLVKNAGESVISRLLPTLDNIERALQAPQSSDETKSFAQGIVMIHQQLLETLEKEGLEVLESLGQPFDPTMHEAIMAVDKDDTPEETILDEVEKGYRLNDKILRPAKVVVSK
ncbi:MAG: nucleotide exchange factor GrpE [Candidatus Latescibacteria bacterium]|jgi:molecular chaperone GrpE|nr:nucleotide exchange factor GrpE [Candidatus Latescibacterota bacterium]